MMEYRAYFKVRFELISPLSIGASDSEDTDRDICLNSLGRPMMPATAIAGVYRGLEKDEKKQNSYFGYIDDQGQKDSLIKFYDAQITGESKHHIAVRDSVALDENKTAMPKAKFDFQAVEPGTWFEGYIEAADKEVCRYVKDMLRCDVSFGSKTTRGYGRVKVSYQIKEFDFPNDLDAWLDFDMFNCEYADSGKWISQEALKRDEIITIKLSLRQSGGLSIRQYSVDPAKVQRADGKEETEEKKADYGPLTLNDKDKTPVIPGTSWAGMFRRHVTDLLGEEYKDDIKSAFGFVCENKKESKKSAVVFSESRLKDCVRKTLVRNAVDRFTNGTKDGALYTEETVYNGTADLEISLDTKDNKVPESVVSAICATIIDLHEGYAAVGGLTSVGRGLFKIDGIKVNGRQLETIGYEPLRAEVRCGK